jgi:hypothetical protein
MLYLIKKEVITNVITEISVHKCTDPILYTECMDKERKKCGLGLRVFQDCNYSVKRGKYLDKF